LAAFDFTLQVELLYASLLPSASAQTSAEPSLGGKLLYAAELDPRGRALLVAGNIAGAASLAATADPAAQKQAIREGVADFLVNTLDEALRILKNEIRKCEAVAVCVAAAPQAVGREMVERGVLPDLLPLHFSSDSTAPLWQRARRIEAAHVPDNQQIVTWRVASAPAQWLPKLDAIAMDCLHASGGPESSAALRWLRLAPRYLGRLAHSFRVLRCQKDAARAFIARVQSAVECGEIGVEVQIVLNNSEKVIRFQPPSRSLR
jgi:hypothetical protein